MDEKGWRDGKKMRLACKGRCDTVTGLSRPLDAPDTREYCCLRRCLHTRADFQEEENTDPGIKSMIKDAGHICLMLPKYHCEFNFIEMYWGATKREVRKVNTGTRAPTCGR